MARIIFTIVAFVIALACLGMVYLALSAGDAEGMWLFAAFAFLFGAPAVASLINIVRKKTVDQASPAGVRFVPHWQLMAMIGIALLAIIAMILFSLR